jgi:predicted phage replisome organizer
MIVWLKVLLHSIEMEEPGVLRFSENIPYDSELLASVIDEDVSLVKTALELFARFDMIKIMSNGDIWIEEINKLIGKQSTSTVRVRKFREKQKLLKQNETFHETNMKQDETLPVTKCNTIVEKEEEVEEEVEKEVEKEKEEEQRDLFYSFEIIPIEFYKRFNTETCQLISPDEKDYKISHNFCNKSSDPVKTIQQVLEVIPDYFEKAYWFNSENGAGKKIDPSTWSFPHFMSVVNKIIAKKNTNPVRAGPDYSGYIEFDGEF